MSIEDEVKAIAANVGHAEGWGRNGQSPTEADVHRQLEGIWTALLMIARELDRSRSA